MNRIKEINRINKLESSFVLGAFLNALTGNWSSGLKSDKVSLENCIANGLKYDVYK